MAKCKGPLMSESASGLFGPRMVFSQRESGQQVRFQRAQRDVITPARTAQRTKYNLALALWRSLPYNQRQYWTDFVEDHIVDF